MPCGALSGARLVQGHKRVFRGRGGGFRAAVAEWPNTCDTCTYPLIPSTHKNMIPTDTYTYPVTPGCKILTERVTY